jgi:signal transduction histidine kinase
MPALRFLKPPWIRILHIASQIARAHEGRIEVTSTEQETRFVFTMPLRRPA